MNRDLAFLEREKGDLRILFIFRNKQCYEQGFRMLRSDYEFSEWERMVEIVFVVASSPIMIMQMRGYGDFDAVIEYCHPDISYERYGFLLRIPGLPGTPYSREPKVFILSFQVFLFLGEVFLDLPLFLCLY